MKRLLKFLLISILPIAACNHPENREANKIANYAALISYIQANDLKSFKESMTAEINLDSLIPDKSNHKSYTLLGYACKYPRIDFMKELMLRKANINIAQADEIYEYDALYVAIEANNEAAVRILLDNGANPNGNYTEDGLSPLALACINNHVENVKILIAKKAYVNGNAAEQGKVFVPLIISVNNDSYQISKLLIAAGADPNLKNTENQSAITVAKNKGNSTIEALLSESAHITASSSWIKNVSFNKGDYSLFIETNKGNYSFENLEFTGYDFKNVQLVKGNIFRLNFGHSSGSRLVCTAEFDTGKETIFITDLQSLSYEKNNPEGQIKKCELKNLRIDINAIDEDELFDRVISTNCSYLNN